MSQHRRSRREFVHAAGLGMTGVVAAPLAGVGLREVYAGQAQTPASGTSAPDVVVVSLHHGRA